MVAAAVVAGCGSTSPPPASSRHERAAGVEIVALPELGVLRYRCEGTRGVQVAFDARTASATETATVEGIKGRHLRAATLNPRPAPLTVPAARYATLTVRVVQSTEPKTLEATIRLHFRWGKNTFACSLTSWRATTNVIGHQGAWSVPKAWP
jgi:hypothetical protein